MKMYDTDGDGFIAGEELDKAAGLKAAIKTFDADKDSKISEHEIADRVLAWKNQSIALLSFTCDVTLDGKPVEGATVTFEPDEFIGGVISSAVDVTNVIGTASPSVPKANRPSETTPPGVQAGTYKVKISKIVDGQETIPARYNVETILGQEVSTADWAIVNKQVRYNMTTKAP
jgi:hypothetical protein